MSHLECPRFENLKRNFPELTRGKRHCPFAANCDGSDCKFTGDGPKNISDHHDTSQDQHLAALERFSSPAAKN